jgi:protein-L-isoaspartate(D-aspartate) O-methyltransferase
MIRKLSLLALIAAAGDAAAEDAKCVSERAAMIETIRTYTRSNANLFGPQGISESILEAPGQTERHRFIPEPHARSHMRTGLYRLDKGRQYRSQL